MLSESDVSDECVTHFNEDQQLEQLINGQICFKIYPFSNGMVKPWAEAKLLIAFTFYFLNDKFCCRDTGWKKNNNAWFFQSITWWASQAYGSCYSVLKLIILVKCSISL